MADLFPDNTNEYSLIAQRAAERKRLAQKMVEQALETNGQMIGNTYVAKNPWLNFAQGFAGSASTAGADNDLSQALKQRQQAQEEWQQQFNAADTPEAKQQLLTTARNKGLRYDLEQQFAKQQQDAIEKGEQLAADRVAKAEEAERKRIEDGEQKAADRVARQEYRQTPAIVIHQGGGSRGGQGSVQDGKPLTAAQEKAALELGSNRSNLQMLSDTFKDEYAGDLRSTIQRKFGEVAGGAAPEKTQEMTRWWANQAMFDELPQRHELFGATLTAGEKAAWASAAISPNMAPKQIRERLAIRAKIYDDAEARMRGSVEAGGKSVKQFDAATGKNAAKPTDKLTPAEQAELDALRAKHGRK